MCQKQTVIYTCGKKDSYYKRCDHWDGPYNPNHQIPDREMQGSGDCAYATEDNSDEDTHTHDQECGDCPVCNSTPSPEPSPATNGDAHPH